MPDTMQLLRDSGLFTERPPQSNGSVCFQVTQDDVPLRGASIYVVAGEQEIHIRVGALENGRFPNNRQLLEFVVRYSYGTAHGVGNSAYAHKLASRYVREAIHIIRTGLL